MRGRTVKDWLIDVSSGKYIPADVSNSLRDLGLVSFQDVPGEIGLTSMGATYLAKSTC